LKIETHNVVKCLGANYKIDHAFTTQVAIRSI